MAQVSLVLKYNSKETCFVSRGFMEDNPCGTLSKSKLMDMYSGVLSKHKANNFIDEIFEKYDTDHDGAINFKVSKGM